jgi:hypothetical protein
MSKNNLYKLDKYKKKYLLELNRLNNYDFGPYLKYIIIDDNQNDYTEEERIVQNSVRQSSYMLPIKTNTDNNEIKKLLQKAIISTNFKNKINKDITDSQSYYIFEYENKNDADKLSNLLSLYSIKTTTMSDTRMDVPFYYLILKPVDMLLLIYFLIGKPVSLSKVQEVSSSSGDYLRVDPNIIQPNVSEIPSNKEILDVAHLNPPNNSFISRLPFRL